MSITHSYVGFSFLSLSGPLTTAPWISIYFRSCFSLTFRRTQDSSVITLLSSFFVFLCLLRTLSHSLQNCGITFGYNVHYHSGMNSVSSFECVIKSIDLFPCILKITLEFRVCISIHFLRVGFFCLWRVSMEKTKIYHSLCLIQKVCRINEHSNNALQQRLPEIHL